MPTVMEAIDGMTTSEKIDAMNHLWASLSSSGDNLTPAWHEHELAKTAALAEAGVESPVPWDEMLSPEWKAEIARRVDDVRTGRVDTIPFDDSLRAAYERIAALHTTRNSLAR